MSRITIDLKKRGEDRTHYDLSKQRAAENEDIPYCYQLSDIRFRDIITRGKSMPKTVRVPREFARKRNLDDSDVDPAANASTILIIARKTAIDGTLGPTSDLDEY